MTENLSVERNTSNQRKLERFSEKKYSSYEAAATAKAILTVDPMTDATKKLIAETAKAKIFARYDGTYDLVFYRKIKTAEEKTALKKAFEATPKQQGEAAVKAAKKTKKKAQ